MIVFKRIHLLIAIFILANTANARQPDKGYRGFIESDNFIDLNFGFIAGDPGDSHFCSGIITSHGYQFNDWLYVGGGTGFIYNFNWKNPQQVLFNEKMHYVIPVFAEVRLDAKWNRFTPYFSTQIGGNVAERGGLYFSPMVGYRFNWGGRCAINLGLGMTMYGNTVTTSDHICTPDGEHLDYTVSHYNGNVVSFTARVGFEFQLP